MHPWDPFCREFFPWDRWVQERELLGPDKICPLLCCLLTSGQCRKDTCWHHLLHERLSQNISNNQKVQMNYWRCLNFMSVKELASFLPNHSHMRKSCQNTADVIIIALYRDLEINFFRPLHHNPWLIFLCRFLPRVLYQVLMYSVKYSIL